VNKVNKDPNIVGAALVDTLNINLRVIKKNYRPGATNPISEEQRDLQSKRAKKEKFPVPPKEIEAKYKMNDRDYKVKYSLWP